MIARPEIQTFHAVAINRLAHVRQRKGMPVIHMEIGQPSAGAPAAAIAAAHESLRGQYQGYWESTALKERIARHYLETQDITVAPERILLTAGGSAALTVAFTALFSPGQAVALARPGYPPHRNVLTALGLEVRELPCGPETRFQPTAAMIAALDPAPAGLVLTSPSNPTGTMLEDAELRAILEVCRRRNIAVVSDETYHGITYDRKALSAAAVDPHVVVINTFSKYWCMTGWRLGWALVPEALVKQMDCLAESMLLVPPTLAQHVALVAMDQTEELEGRVRTYAQNRQRLIEGLRQLGIDRLAPADGAFYLYADIGHLTDDSLAFCLRLLEDTGLALNTGLDFDRLQGGRYLRFSFAVSPTEVEQALSLLAGWLRERKIA